MSIVCEVDKAAMCAAGGAETGEETWEGRSEGTLDAPMQDLLGPSCFRVCFENPLFGQVVDVLEPFGQCVG